MSDYLDRRGFLIGINLTGSIVAEIMAIMLLSGEVRVWPVIVLVAAGGCVLAFALTTRQAYTYDIVGPSHALNGLSLVSMAMQAGGYRRLAGFRSVDWGIRSGMAVRGRRSELYRSHSCSTWHRSDSRVGQGLSGVHP